MGIFSCIAKALDLRRTGGAVAQFNPSAELVEGFIAHRTGAFDQIGFGNFEIRIGETLGELGVVGEDQKTAGVEVQAANRRDERFDIGDQVVDGLAALGVLKCRDVAGGFVEKNVKELLVLQGLVVEENFVAFEIDPQIRVLDNPSVDAYTSGVDPASRLRARAKASFGDDSVECFGFQ